MSEANELERGRAAERPSEIPKRGWKDIAKRVFRGLSQENASIVAAGVAFYAFMAVPAILTALVSIYGMGSNPKDVQTQVSSLSGIVPKEGMGVLMAQLKTVASHSGGSLSLALAISVAFALYSASNSTKSLMSSLNIVYEEQEKRNFLKYNLTALLLTLGGILLAAFSIALIVGVSGFIGRFHVPQWIKTLVTIVRWPILAAFLVSSLAVAFRFGPSRENPKWKWVSWGAMISTALWLAASALFSWYVTKFGSYDKTYGSLSAIVVLLMWFFITAYVVLLGAKINAEMEHQTDVDTTTGEPRLMGQRGAKMADTRGEAA